MDFDALKEKALCLPMAPGVYIMRDKNDKVIYVGKAKKLKNRVSQYFQDTASHTLKTRLMVSHIDHFDVIVAATEFEALILECAQIKRHMPKYNILLKDDKGFPYLRLDMKEPYPRISMVQRVGDDGAGYYGPFGSRSATQSLIEAIRGSLKLPGCSKQFPKDIGKTRPCLYYHMNQCEGWCQANKTITEYREIMEQARQLLLGNYKQVADQIRQMMLSASEELNFELAASLRDRLNAVTSLGQKQMVIAGRAADTDVIGYDSNQVKACFTVLHFRDGELLDKEYETFPAPDDDKAAVASLCKQYYLSRGYAPKLILMPFEIEDAALLSQLFLQEYGRKTVMKVPQKGDNARLLSLAQKNAQEEVNRLTDKETRSQTAINLLAGMLRIARLERIESFDISHTSGTDITASMVVFCDGKPRKSDYKRFKIEGLTNQDDYASMEQVLRRRFQHYQRGDCGFDQFPDLLLIDGGVAHAQVALQTIRQLQIEIPVFGMVKDDRHRTRALVTPNGEEIRIDNQPAVFALIGYIQEETHRFAISYHKLLRSKRLVTSELDQIQGIGPKRKQELLKTFKSVKAIREASLPELERLLPKNTAQEVYRYFRDSVKE